MSCSYWLSGQTLLHHQSFIYDVICREPHGLDSILKWVRFVCWCCRYFCCCCYSMKYKLNTLQTIWYEHLQSVLSNIVFRIGSDEWSIFFALYWIFLFDTIFARIFQIYGYLLLFCLFVLFIVVVIIVKCAKLKTMVYYQLLCLLCRGCTVRIMCASHYI